MALTFVVVFLGVHLVQAVEQPINLCLNQSQLPLNHLQLLHPHCRGRVTQTGRERGGGEKYRGGVDGERGFTSETTLKRFLRLKKTNTQPLYIGSVKC